MYFLCITQAMNFLNADITFQLDIIKFLLLAYLFFDIIRQKNWFSGAECASVIPLAVFVAVSVSSSQCITASIP